MEERSQLDRAAGGQVGECRRRNDRPTKHHGRVGVTDGCGIGPGVVGFADEFRQPFRVAHDLRSAISAPFAVDVRGVRRVQHGGLGDDMHHN